MHKLVWLAALAAPLPAQVLEAGYQTARLTRLPNGVTCVTVLRDGSLVYFTGTDLVQLAGAQQRRILQLPAAVEGGFVAELDGELAFGVRTNGDLWRIPTAPPAAPVVVANLPGLHDGVRADRGTLIVSARAIGGATSELIQVDPLTGATDLLVVAPGAAGPVEWTNDGLWYATRSAAVPPPPGSTELYHWGRAQLLPGVGPGHVTPAQGVSLASGLDPASDLVVDRDFDPILLMDGRVFELSFGPLAGGTRELRRSSLIGYPPAVPQPASLQLVAERSFHDGQFEPFQPGEVAALHVLEALPGGRTELRSVRPLRPLTVVPPAIPPGPFRVVTVGGPANGFGLVAVGWNSLLAEIPFPVNGFDQAVLWDPTMTFAWNTLPVSFDAQGVASLQLFNPGAARPGLTIALQVGFVDARREVLGSAAPVALDLR